MCAAKEHPVATSWPCRRYDGTRLSNACTRFTGERASAHGIFGRNSTDVKSQDRFAHVKSVLVERSQWVERHRRQTSPDPGRAHANDESSALREQLKTTLAEFAKTQTELRLARERLLELEGNRTHPPDPSQAIASESSSADPRHNDNAGAVATPHSRLHAMLNPTAYRAQLRFQFGSSAVTTPLTVPTAVVGRQYGVCWRLSCSAMPRVTMQHLTKQLADVPFPITDVDGGATWLDKEPVKVVLSGFPIDSPNGQQATTVIHTLSPANSSMFAPRYCADKKASLYIYQSRRTAPGTQAVCRLSLWMAKKASRNRLAAVVVTFQEDSPTSAANIRDAQ